MEKRTELGTLGEFGLIDRIKGKLPAFANNTVKGIGDDAAVLQQTGGNLTLVSTDMLVEGIHFDLSYTPLKHLGYKCVAVNVSDIAAMNGIPKQITVSLALSNRFSVEAIDELYEGIYAACENFKVDLVGGDTTSSTSGLIISISVLGECSKEEVVYRNTAKKEQVICVTGDLGAAYFGLQLLEREKMAFMEDPDMQPELEEKNTYLIQKILKPSARMDIIHELRQAKVLPTSMIDISDGLASELTHICRQSGVGAILYDKELPLSHEAVAQAMEFNISGTTAALNGGEDYELLFTVTKEDFEKLKNHPDITAIGITTESKDMLLISESGRQIPIQAQGWVHF